MVTAKMVQRESAMMEKPERRYPLTAIPWPQSVCVGCGHIGSGFAPYRLCRCDGEYRTVFSLKEYRLVATTLATPKAMFASWAKQKGEQV